jgi:uncharacterized alkaline shock family protein YloU
MATAEPAGTAEPLALTELVAETVRSVTGVVQLEPAPKGIRVSSGGVARVDIRIQVAPPPDAASVAQSVIRRVGEALQRVDGISDADVHVTVVRIAQ